MIDSNCAQQSAYMEWKKRGRGHPKYQNVNYDACDLEAAQRPLKYYFAGAVVCHLAISYNDPFAYVAVKIF